MFIKTLEIRNFKNIKEVVINSTNRVNLIIGENGQGKSSIFEALTYILTDELNDKISSFVRWGQKKFEIVCIFEHSGIEYTLEIEGEKGAKKTLSFNGEEYYNSEATAKLKEIIDFELTKYSAISEQGKATQLLFQKKTERLNTLKRILKIDSINESVENIKEDIRKEKEEIKLIEVELNTLKNMSYNYMESFLLPDIEKTKEELSVIEKEKEEYNKKEKEKDDQISVLKNKISEIKLNKEKDKLEKVSSYKDEINKVELSKSQIEEESKKHQRVKESIEKKEFKIVEIENSIKDLKLTVKDNTSPVITKEELKEKEKSCDSFMFEINSLKKDIENIKNKKCPYGYECDKLGDSSQLEEKEQLLIENKEKYNSLDSEISKYRKEWEIFDSIERKNSEINNKLVLLEKDLINEKENLVDLKKDFQADKSFNVSEFDSKINELNNKISEIENFYRDLIKEETVKIESEINDLSVRNVFEKTSKLESLKNEILLYDTKVKELERITKFNDELKEKERENGRIIRTREKDIDEKRKNLTLLDEVKDILDKDFSSHLINKGAEHIKNKMNSVFQKSYGKYEITFEQDKSGIDFFFREDESSELTNVVMASGQEKEVLAIANRLALCSLQNLGILILDEVDHFASPENSLKLFETILNEKSFNQIWVVSHCSDTKEHLENLKDCNVFEIENGEIIN